MIRTLAILMFISVTLISTGCQPQKVEKSKAATNDKSTAQKPKAQTGNKNSKPAGSKTKNDSASQVDKKPAEKNFKNTGLKRDEVLKVVNDNSKGDGKLKHHFVLIEEDKDSTLYEDQHSEMLLQFVGPKDDLKVVEFALSMDSFVSGGKNSEVDQSNAWSNCIKRLSGHLDPGQPDKIHAWMKKNVKRAVFTPNGSETKHQHLLIIFDSNVTPKGTKTINFAVVLPE